MKKNIGAQLALYPCPVIVVGAMVNGKPTYEYFKTGEKAGDCAKMNNDK